MVSASAWVGLTLPGMMEEPGSFSGKISSPRPERGPEPRSRMSFAILKSEAATLTSAPCAKTMASWEASAANLFGAEVKGSLVSAARRAAKRVANSACVLSPVPTAVAALRHGIERLEALAHMRDAKLELRRVT